MLVKKAYAFSLGELRGIGPLGLEGEGAGSAIQVFTNILSSILGIMTIAGGIWFLINLMTAAYQYISAGGDNQKIKEAQQKIQNSIVGLFLIVAAVFILSLFGTLLKVPFLDIGALINRIVNQTF